MIYKVSSLSLDAVPDCAFYSLNMWYDAWMEAHKLGCTGGQREREREKGNNYFKRPIVLCTTLKLLKQL